MAQSKPGHVPIGKFDILAASTYAKALLDGLPDEEAKERGMVAAPLNDARHRIGSHRPQNVNRDATPPA